LKSGAETKKAASKGGLFGRARTASPRGISNTSKYKDVGEKERSAHPVQYHWVTGPIVPAPEKLGETE
jgi:hypothetical protein